MTAVREIMSKPVITLTPQKTAGDAAKLMNEKGIETIVITWGDAIVGIITEKDLVRKVMAMNLPASTKIRDFMANPVITVEANASVRKAKDTMNRHNVKRLPVIEKGKLIGIITSSDIIKN